MVFNSLFHFHLWFLLMQNWRLVGNVLKFFLSLILQ